MDEPCFGRYIRIWTRNRMQINDRIQKPWTLRGTDGGFGDLFEWSMLSELVPRIAHRIIPGGVSQRRIVVGNGYVFEGRFKTDVPAFFPRARTGSDSFRANNPATLISLKSASIRDICQFFLLEKIYARRFFALSGLLIFGSNAS